MAKKEYNSQAFYRHARFIREKYKRRKGMPFLGYAALKDQLADRLMMDRDLVNLIVDNWTSLLVERITSGNELNFGFGKFVLRFPRYPGRVSRPPRGRVASPYTWYPSFWRCEFEPMVKFKDELKDAYLRFRDLNPDYHPVPVKPEKLYKADSVATEKAA